MKLEDLLEQYSKRKKIEHAGLDEAGLCRLVINESLIVALEKSLDGRGFYLYSSVGKVPPEREREISLMALKGNLFGRETGQASLGYLPTKGVLVLFEFLEEACTDLPIFERKIDQFAAYTAYWINKLEQKKAPELDEISLQKHVFDLQDHKNMKIFFA